MLGSFGYRFIADELPARGISAGENKAARLCSQQRTWSTLATATALDRTWLTDITEHPTAEGKVCLRAINDVYSNRIVGYSMNAGLAVPALRKALGVDRRVYREATKFQWNQCFPRYPSCVCAGNACVASARASRNALPRVSLSVAELRRC